MRLPRISTFADPAVIRSATAVLHDAAWLIETRLVETPVTVVLDGTLPVRAAQRERLDALARAVGPCRRIALIRDAVPDWAVAWHPQRVVEVTSGRLDLAEARVTAGLPHGSAVLLVSGQPGPLTEDAIESLGELRPDLRVFLAIASGTSGAVARKLADGIVGAIQLTAERGAPGALTLELAAMPDVELFVHAPCDARDPRSISLVRPTLDGIDRLRVDAITPHVDAPVFVVRAVVQPADAAWPIETKHLARRARAAVDPVESDA